MPGYKTIFPRGAGAAQSNAPAGYVMVSRWIGVSEVKFWMANGGTFIPPEVGRGGRLSVIPFGQEQKPAGILPNQTIRIDFAIPEKALQPAGVEKQIVQPVANTPIYNVSIHLPATLDLSRVLRNRGI
jgi:hypothetical protein